jgi:hypothetical protein
MKLLEEGKMAQVAVDEVFRKGYHEWVEGKIIGADGVSIVLNTGGVVREIPKTRIGAIEKIDPRTRVESGSPHDL